MNCAYRVVWNASVGEWRAASERVTSRRKSMLVLSLALLLTTGVYPASLQANIIASGICTSSGTTIAVGRVSKGGTINPTDGSGTYATVAGCSATGGAKLGTTAFGGYAAATQDGASAFGFNASATGKWATALGLDTVADATSSIALGYGAQAKDVNAVAIGGSAKLGGGSLTVAESTTASGMGAIAIGSNSVRGAQATGYSAVAISGESTASGGLSIALGQKAQATEDFAIAIGSTAAATTFNSVALGAGATTQAVARTTSVTIAGTTYSFAGNNPYGTVSVGTTQQGARRTISNLAAGRISSSSTDAVNGSQLFAATEAIEAVNNRAVQYAHSDGTLNTASISLEGGETGTTITNLANGNVSADSRDAINGSQLYATNQAVASNASSIKSNTDKIATNTTDIAANTTNIGSLQTGLASTTAAGIKYDRNTDDTLNTASVTLEGASGTTITNLADGEVAADSSDAINGSQLYSTNQAVASNTADIESNASSIKSNADDIGANTTDIAANTTNIGSLQTGLASTTAAGIKYDRNTDDTLNTASVTLEGASGTTITNLANGNVSADSRDAINGSQLYATNQAVASNASDITSNASSIKSNTDKIDANTTDLAANTTNIGSLQTGLASTTAAGVKYDTTNGELDKSRISLEGGEAGTAITNLADGNVSADSRDAINGRQLHATNQAVSTNTTNIATNTTNIGSLQTGLASTKAAGVKYDTVDGKLDKSRISLEGGEAGTAITNLANGNVSADSRDAINGSQLHSTNQAVSTNTTNIATNTTNIGSLQTGLASTTAAGVKYDTTNGELDKSRISLEGGEAGTAITNLADGKVAADSRDAINGSQLHSTNQAVSTNTTDIDNLETGLATTSAAGVKYDTTNGELDKSRISLEGGEAGTAITNLADGKVAADSRDAINGSQLYATNQDVASNASSIKSNTDKIDANTTDIAANTTNIGSLQTGLASTAAAGVKYDTTNGELDKSRISLEGGEVGTTITNLADGEVAADSRDAINGSQLYATNQAVSTNTTDIDNLKTGLATTSAAGVKYDRNTDGTLNAASVTLEGASGTTITNLADGNVSADSRDAINGSQLHATNQNVATNAGNIATNTTDIAANTTNIGSLQTGLATTSAAGVKYDTTNGELDKSRISLEGGEAGTTITNLADGNVSANSRDAINGSQLHATNQAVSTNTTNIATNTTDIDNLETGLASTTAAGVKYDTTNGELDKSRISLEGGEAGTAITNLADGNVSADSRDAINGRQLHATNQAVSTNTTNIATNTTDIDNLETGLASTTAAGVKYDTTNGELDKSRISLEGGEAGTAITNLADGNVSANSRDAINGRQLHATNQAVSTNTTDIAANTTNIGSLQTGLASTTAAGIKYDRNADGTLNTASVTLEGASGTTITNLADGEVAADSSDAINGSQLHATNQNVATNAGNIATNTANIATNATNIGSLQTGLVSTKAAGVKYDTVDGKLDKSRISLEGGEAGTAITNLANGNVSADSRDAINGSQLHATNQNVATNAGNIATNTTDIAANATNIGSLQTGLASTTAAGIKYDRNADGTLNTARVTLEGADGTQITNLADGTRSQDAVSLRQLRGAIGALSDTGTLFFHTNSEGDAAHDSLAMGKESIAVGPLSMVNADHGTGIGYQALVETTAVRGMAIGDQSRVSGARSIALGADATAVTGNSVALGAGSVTGNIQRVEGIELYGTFYSFAGAPMGVVSIGAVGTERTLTNVAAGRISVGSTDAVNGSQLHATHQAMAGINQRVEGIMASVGEVGAKVTTLDREVVDIKSKLEDSAGSGSTGALVPNGEVKQGSMDAVNGGQLWQIQQQMASEMAPMEDFRSNSQGTARTLATGDNAVAAGRGAQATVDGGVALGAGAIADRPGMDGAREAFSDTVVSSRQGALSVGSGGNERQIIHVAGGVEDTDAVNVRQMRSVQQGAVNYDRQTDGSVDYRSVSLGNGGDPVQVHNVAAGSAPNDAVNMAQLSAMDSKYSAAYRNLSNRINKVERDASAGIAAVAAMGDAPYVAGKFTYHVGSGYHNGESALGVSLRRTADNGRWSLGMGIGASSADATVSFGISGVIN